VNRECSRLKVRVLTNKYAEVIGRRYYGGCQFVDIAENIRSSAPRSCSAAILRTCSRTPLTDEPGGFLALVKPRHLHGPRSRGRRAT